VASVQEPTDERDTGSPDGWWTRLTIINTRLISHPMNWIIVLLMLVIAGIFGHLLLSLLDQEPATNVVT